MSSDKLELEHSEMVMKLAKRGDAVIADFTPSSAHALHMTVGIAGESGELLDAIKKYALYGKEIDMQNVVEELGDLEFYMAGLRIGLGITREMTLEGNINKLLKGKNARYGEGEYSNEQAQTRADKK